MPRGFRRDREATLVAAFLDPRSFVSLPTVACQPERGRIAHRILYGDDVGLVRKRVFARNKNCYFCGKPCKETDDMHHIRNKPSERCWCDENLAMAHKWTCHSLHHTQPPSALETWEHPEGVEP